MSLQKEYESYLMHHGVKGMKWGVWNEETTARYNGKSKLKETENMPSSSEERANRDSRYSYKRNRRIQVISDVASLDLYHFIVHNNEASKAKKYMKKSNAIRLASPIDEESGLHKKVINLEEPLELKMVNPAYNPSDATTTHNCVCCSIAMDLRKRGYEVRAKTTTMGYYTNEFSKAYKNLKNETVMYTPDQGDRLSQSEVKEFISDVIKDKGYGLMSYSWMTGAHCIFYEVKGNDLKIYDGQDGTVFAKNSLDAEKIFTGVDTLTYTKTDNHEIDFSKVKEFVE